MGIFTHPTDFAITNLTVKFNVTWNKFPLNLETFERKKMYF